MTQVPTQGTKAAPFWGTGRRKTAVAQVRLYPDKGNDKHVVNRKAYTEYFPAALQPVLVAPHQRQVP